VVIIGLFDPEDGNGMSFRKISPVSMDYTALQPKRQYYPMLRLLEDRGANE
jgi:hypothetical protein